uniref:Uncharacterized protein n=1 Tax=Anopheles christyi TaxID=43041 RepID=A0A182KG24_9DIPT
MDTTTIACLLLAVSFSWLPAFDGTTTPETFHAVLNGSLTQCGERFCVAETEVCREDNCECKPHFENVELVNCVPCPAEGQRCRSCCISDALICYQGFCQRCSLDSNGNCISQESLFFLTAAQVALATAMVLGVISLSFLLYKTLRNRLSRVSLSSIQQRVIRRLRDRPPKYETRHNYEYQQRQTERQTSQQSTMTENVSQRNPVAIGGPPPAYDGDSVSLAEHPPPYTQEQTDGTGSGIAVIDIPTTTTTDTRSVDSADDRSSSNLQGITNQAFEPDKHTSTQSQIIQSSDGETDGRPKIGCYDIPLVSSNDKTVYM